MKKLGTMGNTLLFIGSVLFVIIFQIIFGVQNGLIGVSIVMASFTMLRRNLTVAPLKNLIKLILLNVVIGIASILAMDYFWMAVFLSFAIFYFLGYYMLYSLLKPLYIPFALEYLYLFLTPIPNRMIPLRIIALVFGGVVIMAINYLYYGTSKESDENKLLTGICNTLISKCKLINAGESPAMLDVHLNNSFPKLRQVIYDKKQERFSLSDESAVMLTLVGGLEKLNNIIPQLQCDNDQRKILKEIEVFLSTIESVLKTKKLFKLEDALYKIKLREDSKTDCSSSCLSVINLLGFIHEALGEFLCLAQDSKKVYNTLKDNNRKLTLENSKLPVLSFKFYFALRIACGMALATLLSGFFIFSEGVWIIVTTFAIMIPLYGTSEKGIRYEVHGTIIGAVVSYVLFAIFKGFAAGSLIILIASYCYAIADKEFDFSGILTSICAFGMGFIVYDSLNIFNANTLFLIISGAVIAMIFESMLFPYDFNKAERDLAKVYKSTLTEFLEEIYNLAVGEKHADSMNSLLIFEGLLEERILFNNDHHQNDENLKFLKYYRLIYLTIYELYLWMANNDLSKNTNGVLKKYIYKLINEETLLEAEITLLLNNNEITYTLEDKVALNTLRELSALIYDLRP